MVLAEPKASDFALRHLKKADYAQLRDLVTEDKMRFRLRLKLAPPRPGEFANYLWDGVAYQMVAYRTDRNARPVGLAYAYRLDLRNGTSFIGTMMSSEVGADQEAAMTKAFAAHLFDLWNVRKLYCEFLLYPDRDALRGLRDCFAIEARLEAHEYYAGAFYDLEIGALYRGR